MEVDMELSNKNGLLVIMLMEFYSSMFVQKVYAIPVGDSLVNYKLDSKSLIEMGKTLNKSILTLLGLTLEQQENRINRTILNELEKLKEKTNSYIDTAVEKTEREENITETILIELKDYKRRTDAKINAIIDDLNENNELLKSEFCKIKTCTEWAEWSMCSAVKVKTFGVSTRSRTCGMNSQFCNPQSVGDLETDDTICQGETDIPACPSTYTLTTNKFCIRVRNDVAKSWDEAKSDCNKDGGHLINIDSDLKMADVNGTLNRISLANHSVFWIDGQKGYHDTKWNFEYGSDNTGLSAWYGLEPDATDERILYYKLQGVWHLYGFGSDGKRHFICEIIGIKDAQ